MRTVLVTGAAGRVARAVLPVLGTDPAIDGLRLLDRDPAADFPEMLTGDIADRDFLSDAMRGVGTVLHLAANPSAQASWAELRSPNVEGVERVLSAAVEAGVRRVVLASSVHAAGGYVVSGLANGGPVTPVDPDRPPFPCCPYGATKALGESLGRVYSYRAGLSVLCLRFGGVVPHPHSIGGLMVWIGPQDVRSLVAKAITASDDLTYGVYHGLSRPGAAEWDLSNGERDLGYRPVCEAPADLDPSEQRWLCGEAPHAMPAPLMTGVILE